MEEGLYEPLSVERARSAPAPYYKIGVMVFLALGVGFVTLVGFVAAAGSTSACATALDCQMNGVCAPGGCVCDPAWGGADCSTLRLVAPKAIEAAYPPPSLVNTTTSWGGSVIQDDAGKYHMMAAEMANGCELDSWTTNSIIVSAVSSTPEGPYQRQATVMPAFAHNPVVTRAPDGTYLIYHIGCGDSGDRSNGGANQHPCTDCANGATGKSCPSPGETVACSENTTNILFASSLDGPWSSLYVLVLREQRSEQREAREARENRERGTEKNVAERRHRTA